MRSIVHLSDLHFGNHDPDLLEPVLQRVVALAPDLTIVSGDFVERATVAEFVMAKTFVERLPQPRLMVAGNHDLPFYDPVRRYSEGLKLYQQHITQELEPVYRDEEMVVVGINTPRRLQLKGGRIGRAQVEHIRRETGNAPESQIRILVTHHPLDLPAQHGHRTLVAKARRAVEAISPAVDLLLAGHIHVGSTGETAVRYLKTGRSAIFAQAGSAFSNRNKGEANSFNFLRLGDKRISIQHQRWVAASGQFEPESWMHFEHVAQGWTKLTA